jgi:hypothetical protein
MAPSSCVTLTAGSRKKYMQKSAKIINKEPMAMQIISAGLPVNPEITRNIKPAAIAGKIKGYPSFRIDIVYLSRIIH